MVASMDSTYVFGAHSDPRPQEVDVMKIQVIPFFIPFRFIPSAGLVLTTTGGQTLPYSTCLFLACVSNLFYIKVQENFNINIEFNKNF